MGLTIGSIVLFIVVICVVGYIVTKTTLNEFYLAPEETVHGKAVGISENAVFNDGLNPSYVLMCCIKLDDGGSIVANIMPNLKFAFGEGESGTFVLKGGYIINMIPDKR